MLGVQLIRVTRMCLKVQFHMGLNLHNLHNAETQRIDNKFVWQSDDTMTRVTYQLKPFRAIKLELLNKPNAWLSGKESN